MRRALISSLALVSVLVSSACGSLQGLAGCSASASESPVPTAPSIRTIKLDQRWTGDHRSVCFYEIRISDGRFVTLGDAVAEASCGVPWPAALRAFSRIRSFDEASREDPLGRTED